MKLYSLLALGVLAAAPLVGCYGISGTPTGSSPAPGTGTIEAAVSAVGSDGATYSIPTSDTFYLAGPGGTYCFAVPGTPTYTTYLPAGSYTFYLSQSGCASPPADAGTQSQYTLTRAIDGGSATVAAVLANPVQSVTVSPGSSTSLVFNFELETLGNVTTPTGKVTVSMSLGDGGTIAVSPTRGTATDTFTGSTYQNEAGDAGAALAALVPGTLNGSFSIAMSSLTTFVPTQGDGVCANFTGTITPSSNSAGLNNLLTEACAPGATGQLCFYDPYSAEDGADAFSFTVTRGGSAVTSAISAALGGANATFEISIQGTTSVPLYTGSAIDFSLFPNGVTFNASTEWVAVSNSSGTPFGGVTFPGQPFTLNLTP